MKLLHGIIVLILICVESVESYLDFELVIFVKTSGSDDKTCGFRNTPCKSMKYALERSSQSNVTSVLVDVFPGIYPPESVKIDCTAGHLRRVTIRGLGENTIIGLSADIIKCNVVFDNVKWANSSKPILINAIISELAFFNSTISKVAFSLLSSGCSIDFISCLITNCSGWQPLFPLISTSRVAGFDTKLSLKSSSFSFNEAPLISAKVVNFVAIKKAYFFSNAVNKGEMLIMLAGSNGFIDDTAVTDNRGGFIAVTDESYINITTTLFSGNDVLDSTLINVGQGVSFRASRCLFTQSYGTSEGPVMVASKDARAVYFNSCFFSCNKVNNSVHVSPIKNNAAFNIVNCTNCTTNFHCPVFCGSGKYLADAVMCRPCPVGTYHHGSDYNITAFACKKCDPGYYSSKKGSSGCKPCKPGNFASKSGSSMCLPCKNDFMTSGKGESSCSRLTVGFTVLTICVICLIVFPLVVLLVKYMQTSKRCSSSHPRHFKRLHDIPPRT